MQQRVCLLFVHLAHALLFKYANTFYLCKHTIAHPKCYQQVQAVLAEQQREEEEDAAAAGGSAGRGGPKR